jgi:hypothetical protein
MVIGRFATEGCCRAKKRSDQGGNHDFRNSRFDRKNFRFAANGNQPALRSKWYSLTKNQAVLFILAVAGGVAVLEPFALPYLVQLLPAPTVTVNVSGFHFIFGHEIGCIARLLQIITPS